MAPDRIAVQYAAAVASDSDVVRLATQTLPTNT